MSNWSFALSRSTNAGASWSRSFIEQTQRGWCRALAVAPSATARIYAGGWVVASGAVAVSTDQGASWTRTAAPAETVFGLAVHPLDPLTVVAATSGGVSRSTDGGGSWTGLYQRAGMRAVAFHPGGPDTLVAGGDGGAFASRDGGATWTAFDEGMEGRAVVALAFSADEAVRLFAGTGNAAAFRYSYATGVAEAPRTEPRTSVFGPTVVRGNLDLPELVKDLPPVALLDASGRKVMTLSSGANDIGSLAPGVYFVRREDGSPVRRVVVAR